MAKEAKRPRGGQTKYRPDLAAQVCELVGSGQSLRAACRAVSEQGDAISDMSVRRWAIEDVDGFASQFARACEIRAHLFIEQAIEISDNGAHDLIASDKGERVDWENIQRSKLRVDTRKWIASKVLPRLYGDRVELHGVGGAALIPQERAPVPDDVAVAVASELVRMGAVDTKRVNGGANGSSSHDGADEQS